MATAKRVISVEEYLHTAYHPDCDYVDGAVLERNLGQHDHARLQALILFWLMQHEAEWGIYLLPEQRLCVAATRYRVPDLMVLAKDAPRTPVIEQAPLLCIEIVSPADRLTDLTLRAKDYAELGVPQTWILDPETREVFVYAMPDRLRRVAADVELRCGQIMSNPGVLFAQI